MNGMYPVTVSKRAGAADAGEGFPDKPTVQPMRRFFPNIATAAVQNRIAAGIYSSLSG